MTAPEKERQIVEAYETSVPMGEIVDRFNVSASTVVNIARRNGIPLRSQGRPRGAVTREEASRFAELLHDGYSHSTAAGKVGRSIKTILSACQEFEIEIDSDTAQDHDSYVRMVMGYNRGVTSHDRFGLAERSIPIGISL